MFLWIVCIALVTALIFGELSRFLSFGAAARQCAEGATRQASERFSGYAKGLVVVQFAVSAILIAGTLVVYQQMDLVHGKYLGF